MQDEVVKLRESRMKEQAHVTELEDLLNSNLLKQQQELTQRLQQADVEQDRFVLTSPAVLISVSCVLPAY